VPLDLDVLEGLSTLVDQSLVQQREEGSAPRFGMLHVLREYALEQLEASGEAEALRRAHAACYLTLAEQAEPALTGPEQGVWLERLEGEHDNLRAALGWAREPGEVETGLRLVAALWWFWRVRGHLREGRAWVAALLGPVATPAAASEAATATRARALFTGGDLALWQSDFAAAAPWLEQATTQARATGDVRTAAHALNSLGLLALHQGDQERAAAYFEESLTLTRAVGDQRGIGQALNNLGNVAVYQGDLERAAAAFAEALAHFRQAGDRGSVALALMNLGWVARKRGEVAQAKALLHEALALFRELGDPRRCAEGLEELAATAGVAEPAGQGERAARLLGAAAAVRETLGAPPPPEERAETEQGVAAARAALGEERWAAAFAAGQALTLEQAIAEALGEAG
jgi:non-specific serine/threonine protein kinase